MSDVRSKYLFYVQFSCSLYSWSGCWIARKDSGLSGRYWRWPSTRGCGSWNAGWTCSWCCGITPVVYSLGDDRDSR